MEDWQVNNSPDDAITGRVIPILHAVAAVGLTLWMVTVVAWPWLAHGGLDEGLAHRFERFMGSYFCHRMPGRSLSIGGTPLLVCSRCTGVIAGYLFGAVMALCGAERLPFWRVPWAIAFIGLMGLSWLGGWLGFLHASWHFERVIAGACGGLGGYILISRCVILFVNWLRRRVSEELEPTSAA